MKKIKTDRRDFIKSTVVGLAGLGTVTAGPFRARAGAKKARIALVKTGDRKQGVREALRLFDPSGIKGKSVLMKPNFNTADPFPGSTHIDTLRQLVLELKERDAAEIMIGERSGPPPTYEVMEKLGVFDLSQDLDFGILNFEDLEDKDWIHTNPVGNHWKEGFYVPRQVIESDYVLATCCLKTHQYGGVFTLSLKLSVGLTPKKMMRELHRSPDMRKMIAEINRGYRPQLIVLDGVEAFVDGGPMTGEKKTAEVFLAGDDRVAIDALGLAVLKDLGSNHDIMSRKIFEQEQIKRAVELDLGIGHPDQIEFITGDEASKKYAEKLQFILSQGCSGLLEFDRIQKVHPSVSVQAGFRGSAPRTGECGQAGPFGSQPPAAGVYRGPGRADKKKDFSLPQMGGLHRSRRQPAVRKGAPSLHRHSCQHQHQGEVLRKGCGSGDGKHDSGRMVFGNRQLLDRHLRLGTDPVHPGDTRRLCDRFGTGVGLSRGITLRRGSEGFGSILEGRRGETARPQEEARECPSQGKILA